MNRNRIDKLKTCCFLLLLLFFFNSYCQNRNTLLQAYPSVKDQGERNNLIYEMLNNPDPKKGLYCYRKLLSLTQKHDDKAGEAYVTVLLAFAELLAGNTATVTEITFKGL